MFQFIIIFTMLIMLVTLYVSIQYSVKEDKNLLLGIRLPVEYRDQAEVKELFKTFQKSSRIILVIFFAAMLPVILIEYTSILITVMSLWFILYMWLCFYCVQYYGRKLMLLKSRNRWFSEDGGEEILKDKKILSWFQKHRLLTDSTEIIYVDDDKYWLKGYYYNPEDKKTIIKSRFRGGTSLNMAARGAKVLLIGIFAFSGFILGGVILLFAVMDFSSFKLIIDGDNIQINAPLYGYQFRTEEVKEITLNEGLPENGRRTNGAGTDTYLLGNFYYEEYGKAKDYLYKDTPFYISIRLDNLTVFFNARSEDKTRDYYEILKEVITH